VNKKIAAFTINTLCQAEKIILETKKYKIKPIFHFKYYILRGFGSEFVLTFQKELVSKFGKSSFKLFVDCGFDISLGIVMATKKIEYIKVRGNSIILKKFKYIANQNRVLLNPTFNVVDCRNIKKINTKINKMYFRK
tara:strand:+ start:4164 stop:4574 length:411 start_codon:yes stop_codon:yes gene_type:complete